MTSAGFGYSRHSVASGRLCHVATLAGQQGQHPRENRWFRPARAHGQSPGASASKAPDSRRRTSRVRGNPPSDVRRHAAPGPVVALDKEFYGLLSGFEQRFPAGQRSLRHRRRFEVDGDVTFGANVVAVGDVDWAGLRSVPDAEELSG